MQKQRFVWGIPALLAGGLGALFPVKDVIAARNAFLLLDRRSAWRIPATL
tara:strand:- start:4152 stop:4301 length:150 start_codon:yes stop_codon:yes gene_type:complete